MGQKRKSSASGPSGVLVLDKPIGPTSREVIAAVTRRLGLPASGHCGTLDPLATGLLVLVSGYATRVQDLFMGHAKEYVARIRFGATSATDDAEGPIVENVGAPPESIAGIAAALERFVGTIEQIPPALSAVHIDGERAFEKARRGESVDMPARRVVIHACEILGYDAPRLELRVRSGPGTYIRSLARDLGQALGTGAYLEGLRRTASGSLRIETAVAADLATVADVRTLEACLAAEPRSEIPPDAMPLLLQGKVVPAEHSAPLARESLIWCGGIIVGRGSPFGDAAVRLKRLIRPL